MLPSILLTLLFSGICKRGLSCQYKHDPSKVAICHGVLTAKGCTKPPGTCLLSHDRRPNRVPHCTHYLSGNCRFGKECFYVHSDKVKPDSPICKDFSTYGWCDKGEDCESIHTWECPEFAEKGSCSKPGCNMAHVIRASTSGNHSKDADAGPGNGVIEGFGDDRLFMRDDVAAGDDDDDDEGEDSDGAPLKRKHGGDEESSAGEEAAEEVMSFLPRKKKRAAKEFLNQQDFIGFGDKTLELDDNGSEDEEDEEASHEDHAESVDSDDEEEEEDPNRLAADGDKEEPPIDDDDDDERSEDEGDEDDSDDNVSGE